MGLSPLRTYAEAAAEMRVPERTLRTLVARHGTPVLRIGRRVMFDDAALLALREALRRCPSSSHDAADRRSGGSPELSPGSAFAKALALTSAASPRKSAPRGKPQLFVVPSSAPRRV